MKKLKRHSALSLLVPGVILCVVLSSLSCQYDYNSPLPGIIEIHLATKSTHIAFTPLDNFSLQLSNVEAVRSNGTLVVILGDLEAIQRTTTVYNTLDSAALDSSLIIGREYAPPGDYVGVDLEIEPASTVILDGYRDIDVDVPENFSAFLSARNKPFTVSESKTTRINFTVNLDSTLVQGALVYHFRPYYYISSIQ